MALWLQIVIAGVLLALCAALVPLLLQLRRTAQAIQHLAESARVDLSEMARDVHQVRTRLDQLADLATASLALPATLGDLLLSLSRSLPDLLSRPSSSWVGVLLAGVKFVMNIFSGAKKPAADPEGADVS